MKSHGLAVGAFIASLLIGPPAAVARDQRAEAMILQIERDLAAAQTAEDVLQHFDPRISLYDITPPEIDGIAALKESLLKQYAQAKNFSIDIIDIKVEADGELGFARSIQRVTVPSGLPKTSFVIRQTDCYHNVKGRWLIVSQHVSVPINFATDRGVYDWK